MVQTSAYCVSGLLRTCLKIRMPCPSLGPPLVTLDGGRISRIRRSQVPLAAGMHQKGLEERLLLEDLVCACWPWMSQNDCRAS